MTGTPSRPSSTPRNSKPCHAAWEKFVAPLEEITPSTLAGPGVPRPTARTDSRATPVRPSTWSTASMRAPTAASGPSRTWLGLSTSLSTRKCPETSSSVALLRGTTVVEADDDPWAGCHVPRHVAARGLSHCCTMSLTRVAPSPFRAKTPTVSVQFRGSDPDTWQILLSTWRLSSRKLRPKSSETMSTRLAMALEKDPAALTELAEGMIAVPNVVGPGSLWVLWSGGLSGHAQ